MEFVKSLWNNPTCMRYIKIGGAIVLTGAAYLTWMGYFKTVYFKKK